MLKGFQILLFALLTALGSNAQKVRFRLVATDSTAAISVRAVNLVTEQTAVSDDSGEFSIEAKADHLLVFPSERYEYKRYLVAEEDLKRKVVTVVLVKRAVELDEVEVSRQTAIDIAPEGQKTYTPKEKKMQTAISGGLPNVAANLISGKIKMLKRQIKAEKKEGLAETLSYQYPDSHYTASLKIPEDYVKGFQYFCVEDKDVEKALLNQDKKLLSKRMLLLSLEYIELIAKEESESKP